MLLVNASVHVVFGIVELVDFVPVAVRERLAVHEAGAHRDDLGIGKGTWLQRSHVVDGGGYWPLHWSLGLALEKVLIVGHLEGPDGLFMLRLVLKYGLKALLVPIQVIHFIIR